MMVERWWVKEIKHMISDKPAAPLLESSQSKERWRASREGGRGGKV